MGGFNTRVERGGFPFFHIALEPMRDKPPTRFGGDEVVLGLKQHFDWLCGFDIVARRTKFG